MAGSAVHALVMAICPACRRTYPANVLHCDADGTTLIPEAVFASVDVDLREGEVVGEYRVEHVIGRGSFGVVYRALHPIIGKAAAVKVLRRELSSDADTVGRFVAEARAVNQISHRNIVDIFAFGVLPDGRQFHVMELLEGEPLDQYLAARGPMDPAEALPILDRIGRALDAAHAAGIVHRDLKPANVFLANDGEGGRVPKLLDFGIAKLSVTGNEGTPRRTRTGVPLGTPHYMSPEQCRGEQVDHRADIYAFGVMTHEMLTGHLPFDDDSLLKVLMKHLSSPPPSVSRDNPRLSPVLDLPVLRMLAKVPELRPGSLAEALHELSSAIRSAGSDVALQPTPPPDRVPLRREARTLPVEQTLRPQTFPSHPPLRLVRSMRFALPAFLLVGIALTVVWLDPLGLVASPAPASPSVGVEPSGRLVVTLPKRGAEAGVSSVATEVRIAVDAEPRGAFATVAGRLMGTVPGSLVLPRGGVPVDVVFSASGHRSAVVRIVPDADGSVRVRLSPLQPPASKGPGTAGPMKDLEF